MDPEKRIFLCPSTISAFLSYLTSQCVNWRLRDNSTQSKNQVEAELATIFLKGTRREEETYFFLVEWNRLSFFEEYGIDLVRNE